MRSSTCAPYILHLVTSCDPSQAICNVDIGAGVICSPYNQTCRDFFVDNVYDTIIAVERHSGSNRVDPPGSNPLQSMPGTGISA
ncbi:hypothetical protein HETIRDRAFT_309880 [Heterobasidion irregulare TC 32-1]|uniref:Uncharacterized protein n=1 Tax=Heterobasidion irregulare (strain TC 32-1) TaxID=747525 RepID=W4KHH1_HETIT|nr:uncharacterized protein HETIRDRAFT_309880 [Heterobasidion irregulare TC 32-1]ETW85283.1 hypothetical protein HETIRDRAFT_309880 [Heterobasidion irregulare TC 32-1]